MALQQVVGDSVLTSVSIAWAGVIDYFVQQLLDGQWPMTTNGTSIDYWPGVADDPSANFLSEFSSHIAYDNVLDIESRMSTMRQGISPRVFCGNVSSHDGSRVDASAYLDQITGRSCNKSQIEAPDSRCCLTNSHLINDMTYLVKGGIYPAVSDSKWGTFDGFAFTEPALCVAGTAFNFTARECLPCSPGSAAAAGTYEACPLCDEGMYASLSGMRECYHCDLGYYADETGQIECKPCPTGATCDDRIEVVVQANYWRVNSDSTSIFRCPITGACALGGSCNTGFRGPLCATCVQEYYFSLVDKTCLQCPVTDDQEKIYLGSIFLGSLVLVLSVAVAVKTHVKKFADCWLFVRCKDCYRIGRVRLSLIIFTCQTVGEFSYISSQNGDAYSSSASVFAEMLSLANADVRVFAPITCRFGRFSFYQRLVLKTVMPLALVFLLWMVPLKSFLSCRKDETAKKARAVALWTMLIAEVFLLSVSTTILQTFPCVSFAPETDRYFLREETTIPCDGSGRRAFFLTYSSLMVCIWPVGETAFPALI